MFRSGLAVAILGLGVLAVSGESAELFDKEVVIKGGSFRLHAGAGEKDGPVQAREMTVASFALDAYAVSNAQFRAFVRATKYVSEAEHFGWSFVFRPHLSAEVEAAVKDSIKEADWWAPVGRAYWRAPEGPKSSIKGRESHPAVHMSWNDASAYCKWKGKRLPTEAEWEFAVRDGLRSGRFPWGGSTSGVDGRINSFQGTFPQGNTRADGFAGVGPVHAYRAQTSTGLFNMIGNAWEWTSDVFEAGPTAQQHAERRYVLRGGSFVDSIDGRVNHALSVTTRMGNTADSGSDNLSFRCARSLSESKSKPKSDL